MIDEGVSHSSTKFNNIIPGMQPFFAKKFFPLPPPMQPSALISAFCDG